MYKSILNLSILCSLSTLAMAQIPTNGLVIHFPFNGNANDVSGNTQNGTASNVAAASDRFGNSNGAYFFKGLTDSYVEFPTTKVQVNRFTYSLWANPASIPSAGNIWIALNIGSANGYQSINLHNNYASSTGWGGGGYNTSTPHFPLQSRSLPPDSNWYHLVYLRDSTKVKLFVNGVLVDSVMNGSVKYPSYGSSPQGFVGIRMDKDAPFHGAIDEVLIYDRALSNSEIRDIYLDHSAGIRKAPSPISGIKIYPNPASNSFRISADIIGCFQVRILDLSGREVYTGQNVTSGAQINSAETLLSGVYSIMLLDNNNQLLAQDKLLIH
jgi:hypothetical protein